MNIFADDIARAKNTYVSYLAATAAKRSSSSHNYEDVKSICMDKNTFQNPPDVSLTNLRKVSSTTNVVPASDTNCYTNMTIPNVISDALASTEAQKLLPTDLYFASDNKVYNITGYTNSLDRINRKHTGYPVMSNIQMDYLRRGTNNFSKHVDVIPEMQNYNPLPKANCVRPSSNELKLNVSNNSTFNMKEKNTIESQSPRGNATIISTNNTSNFVIVSAPEGFVSSETTIPSPQTPAGAKVRN